MTRDVMICRLCSPDLHHAQKTFSGILLCHVTRPNLNLLKYYFSSSLNLLEKGEPGYEISHIAFSDGILLICGESMEQIPTSNESFCFLKLYPGWRSIWENEELTSSKIYPKCFSNLICIITIGGSVMGWESDWFELRVNVTLILFKKLKQDKQCHENK